MNRRQFALSAAAFAGAMTGRRTVADSSDRAFRLSSHGCSRATAYAESNKILTIGDKTHVAWLDSVSAGFRVRIRTLDRKTGSWSPVYTVGEAYDNHGGPALTVDSRGYLHIVYYPHHHPFRYRRSLRPNDASQWSDEVSIGERCTYPTLVVGPDDTLYLSGRVSNHKNEPWQVQLFTKPAGAPWQEPRSLIVADEPGYSHFQEALAWGPDHRTLHLSTRMYGGRPGRSHTVGYMRTRDFGETWERSDGTPVKLPATSSTLDVIAHEEDGKSAFRCGAIAVDGRGRPHVLYSAGNARPPQAWIASPDGNGSWNGTSLHPIVQRLLPGRAAYLPGGLYWDANDGVHIALTVAPWTADRPRNAGWGHPSEEVALLGRAGGDGSWQANMLSDIDPEQPHWLPNIERPTGFNHIDRPGIIYTGGGPGKDNRQLVANEVWWRRD